MHLQKSTLRTLFVAGLLGIPIGLGFFTFFYARGYSYLSNDPRACVNCHVMQDHYDHWQKSSHHHVAVCNDCHSPHDFFGKYWVKSENGFWHSYAFTTGDFKEPIRIRDRNRHVTEQSCRSCHQGITHDIASLAKKDGVSCLHCHRSVGHGP